MYPTSQRFLDALRSGGTLWSTATHRNLVTGKVTPLPIEDGSITDDVNSDVRRSLSLTLAPTASLWDDLNTHGGEITVTQTVQFVDQATETIPMGVFIVDQEQLDYAASGQITMTCPDRWLKVQRNRFGLSRASVPGNTAAQEIKRLVEGAWPGSMYPFPGWVAGLSPADLATATPKVGSRSWDDGDRARAVIDLYQANGLELFSSRDGLFAVRPVPQLTPTSQPVWLVDASQTGVMISAQRQRDRSNLRNVIIAGTSATDVVFTPVQVANTTVGDPLNVTGPLGFVPEDWQSASFRNSGQAQIAAKARLSKRLGTAQSVSLTAASNPALDGGDVFGALYPGLDANQPPMYELHIADSVQHPLMPGGVQTIQTRSTRPVTDGTP